MGEDPIVDDTKYNHFLKIQKSYSKKIRKLSKLKKIKVAFLVTFKATFPARPVFEKMLDDDYFDPYIIVIPNVFRTMKYQIDLYRDTYSTLHEQFGDRVIHGYNEQEDTYLELGEKYGIMFFANPYKHYDHPYHNIEYFLDKNVLPVYLNYGFPALKFWEEVIAFDFYNYMWKVCIENDSNLIHLQQHETIRGINGLVTGYIKADDIARESVINRTRKTILICPHHTVFGWSKLNISNFLQYAELFLKLPRMYPEIDFVFRPHPLLWTNLRNNKIWSQVKIETYLEEVRAIPNMIFDESAYYFDKFVNSDAMIHDCGSFIAEYLFTKKPCCYMMRNKEMTMRTLTPFGQKCMDNYYSAFCEQDIIDFIDNVVLKREDPMKEARETFVEKELMVNYPHATDYLIGKLKELIKTNSGD